MKSLSVFSLFRTALLPLVLLSNALPAMAEVTDLGNVRAVGVGRIGDVVVRHVLTFGDQCLDIQVLAPDANWKMLSSTNFCSFDGKSFNDGYAYVGIEDLKVAPDGVHLTLELMPLRLDADERRACVIPVQGTKIKGLSCAKPSKE